MSLKTSDSNRLKRVFGAEFDLVDATVAMQATVLPSHMKGAKKDSAVCCGIAKALGGKDVAIMRTTAYVKMGRTVFKYKNGDDAQAFIKMFDTGGLKLTKPMKITLLPVPPSQTRTAYLTRRKTLKARIAAGKPPRAYQKPTMARGSKVLIYQPHKHRTVITDRDGRCAARYQDLKWGSGA